MTQRFPTAFGGQRRGGFNNQRRYQEVRYPAPEKKVETKTVNTTSELDFPSLSSNWGETPKSSTIAGGSTFATLATKWKKDEEEEEARIQLEKEQAEKKRLEDMRYTTTSRIFSKGYNYSNKYSDYDYDEDGYDEYDHYAELDHYEKQLNATNDENAWSTVEKH